MRAMTRPEDAAPPGRRDGVQALARGLAVMRALAAAPAGATIAEAARATALTRAGARRLLLTLVELGYARQDGRRFQLTPRVLDLAGGLFAGSPLARMADPVAERLCRDLGQTVSLGILDGADVVYLLRHDPPRPIRLGIRAGFRLPAHASSMGWVLLAGLPGWQLERLVQRTRWPALTDHTETDPARLLAGIEAAGRAGHAFLDSTAEEGVAGLSVPLRDPGGRPAGALNLSVRSARFDRDRAEADLLAPLRAAAAEIEALLAAALPGRWPL
jgi:IclR family pca regulon transcriptional regulator